MTDHYPDLVLQQTIEDVKVYEFRNQSVESDFIKQRPVYKYEFTPREYTEVFKVSGEDLNYSELHFSASDM